MDAVTRLHRQLVDYSNSLFQEGILDNQFGHLQQLQDESNPDFVAEVVNLYFKDSERLLNEITVALCQQYLQHLKQEYYLVKNKLQTLFQLQQQLLSAGGSIPAYEMR
ncbi:Histidine-containing phosphotransfer protein 1 [Citrus sinensis]|nr:Histidine-containing phosphotransfer protein 1 [Citrus sinensis]